MGTRWEVDDADWDRVREQLRSRLEALARQGNQWIRYGDLVRGIPEIAGPDSYALHEMLGEISTCCHKEEGLPLLSSLVVTKETGRPGKGFYDLAIRLSLLPRTSSAAAREDFWVREVQKCYEAWRR